MGLHFTIHTEGLDALKSELSHSCSRASHALAKKVKEDTEPYVPMDNSVLRNDTKVVGDTIIYPGPYARYLYYGKLYVDPLTGSPFAKKDVTKVPANPERNLKYWHPGTCSHWFEVSKAQNKDKWVKVAAEALKNGR